MKSIIKNQLQSYTNSLQDRKHDLSSFTHARIGLGHTGGHLPLQHWLAFQAGFAQAKDAVVSELDVTSIKTICQKHNQVALELLTQANDVIKFLLRPDLGRQLSASSEAIIKKKIDNQPSIIHRDLLLVISGGLSPIAISHQLDAFLASFIPASIISGWSLAPIIVNPRGRVALGDQINTYFKAKITIMLIGERPGLSTADSMGIYLTYNAKPGTTDDQRNCISNIHQNGLSYDEAAATLCSLIAVSLNNKISGLSLNTLATHIS